MSRKQFMWPLYFCMSLILFFTSGNVLADSFSHGSAVVDWSSLCISWSDDGNFNLIDMEGQDKPIHWAWSPDPSHENEEFPAKFTYSHAQATVGSGSISQENSPPQFGWSSTTASADLSPIAVISSTSSDDLLLQASSSSAPYYATHEDQALGWAEAWFNGHFIVGPTGGTIAISLPYILSIDQTIDNPSYENLWSFAFSILHLGLYDSNGDPIDDFENTAILRTWEETGFDPSGTMNLEISLAAGATGYIAGGAKSFSGAWDTRSDSAPVPEPATMLLLGTGLAGLVGLRRKLKKK